MFRRRRRSKKREAEAVGALIFVGLIFGIINFVFTAIESAAKTAFAFLKTTNGKIALSAFALLLVAYIFRKIQKAVANNREQKRLRKIADRNEVERQQAISSMSPSSDRTNYLIENDDYRRGNPKEGFYRKTFSLHLLETFDNTCAKCGDKENGVDIDHFIFSKNEGGCFIMKHKDGYLVNNAIPLCRTCNRSKSDSHYKSFFTDEELLSIFQRSLLMTKRLNERPIFGDNGELIKQKKTG